MDHADHVALLADGIAGAPIGVWADFGSGAGAFTMALADLLGPDATIHSIDRDAAALREQARHMAARFPRTNLHQHVADFTRPIADLPPLVGIVTANSLHFQRDAQHTMQVLADYLKPDGRWLVVEYNVERGNYAVLYPLPFGRWRELAAGVGLGRTRLLRTRPSRFLHEIYSAVSE